MNRLERPVGEVRDSQENHTPSRQILKNPRASHAGGYDAAERIELVAVADGDEENK